MSRYRKKTVVINAFQMKKERRLDNKDWPNRLNKAWNKEPYDSGCLFCDYGGEQLFIHTRRRSQSKF